MEMSPANSFLLTKEVLKTVSEINYEIIQLAKDFQPSFNSLKKPERDAEKLQW